ncbi:MAG: hypothetical protein ACK4RS_06345, partial [Thiothrix sp.]
KGQALAMLQDGLSRNLAKRVAYHLTAVRNRSFNRFPKNATIGMVTRLNDVLTVLHHTHKKADSADMLAEDYLFNVFVASDYETEDAARVAVLEQASQQNAACIQTWKVINTSVGGYGLCWEGKETSGARVGEIVGLCDLKETTPDWMVGVIKWMEFAKGKGLCCGVELLSTKVMVLSVQQVLNRNIVQKLPIDGIMLPSIEGARPDPALILPAYTFQVGDEIRLLFAEREERVRLVMLDECLGTFAYFRFTTLAAQASAESEDDYESLWQTL